MCILVQKYMASYTYTHTHHTRLDNKTSRDLFKYTAGTHTDLHNTMLANTNETNVCSH